MTLREPALCLKIAQQHLKYAEKTLTQEVA